MEGGTKYVNRKVKYLFASVKAEMEENRRTHTHTWKTLTRLKFYASECFFLHIDKKSKKNTLKV